jgi:hypothetical protein
MRGKLCALQGFEITFEKEVKRNLWTKLQQASIVFSGNITRTEKNIRKLRLNFV